MYRMGSKKRILGLMRADGDLQGMLICGGCRNRDSKADYLCAMQAKPQDKAQHPQAQLQQGSEAGHPSLVEVVMDPKLIAVVAGVVVVAVVVIAMVVGRQRRKAKLRQQFGPEYERAVREVGPARAANVLLAREKRVAGFSLRDLNAEERQSFMEQWRVVQSRFVDDPVASVADADTLVDKLMAARGYPMSEFDQRVADVSVGHAAVVENYRAAHAIALKHRAGEATTEDLRNAFVHYRALFNELLKEPGTPKKAVA